MRNIVYDFNKSSKNLFLYPNGTTKITWSENDNGWVLTNDDNASKYLQFVTDKLKFGDIIAVDFDCNTDVTVLIENVNTPSTEHITTTPINQFENHISVKLPCITSDKKRVSVGLKGAQVKSAIISNLVITVKTDIVPKPEISKLQVNIKKENGVWIRKTTRNGNNVTIVDRTNFLEVTFLETLPAHIVEPCVFTTLEWLGSWVGIVLPAYQTRNQCNIKFFDMNGVAIKPFDLPNDVHFSILMQ